MTSAIDTVRAFYAALAQSDAPAALGLMAEDIEWSTMWHYRVVGRGPHKVAEFLLEPLMAEPTVKAVQATLGSRAAYAKIEPRGAFRTDIDEHLAGFLEGIGTAYLATANAAGHRSDGAAGRCIEKTWDNRGAVAIEVRGKTGGIEGRKHGHAAARAARSASSSARLRGRPQR
jgi:hypothetical protein